MYQLNKLSFKNITMLKTIEYTITIFAWILSIIAIALHYTNNMLPTLQFIFALLGLIVMAKMVGDETEELAEKSTEIIGGILSAFCGNIPELIFSIVALFNGEYSLLLATMFGSVVSNLLLVMGTSIIVGSYKNGFRQNFKHVEIHDLALLLLFGTSFLFITTSTITNNSVVTILLCCILIISLIVFTIYQLTFDTNTLERVSSIRSLNYTPNLNTDDVSIPVIYDAETQSNEPNKNNSVNLPKPNILCDSSLYVNIFKLTIISVMVGLLSDIITQTCYSLSNQIGVSKEFIGFFVVAIAGNAAEHWTAILAAYNNQIDLSITIVESSAIQISCLIIPIVVLLSFSRQDILWLQLNRYQNGMYFIAMFMLKYVVNDNKTNMVEGIFLTLLYLSMAIVYTSV